MQIISSDISDLQKNQATTVAKIAQYKRKLMDLSHRVLQVSCLAGLPLFCDTVFWVELTREESHLHIL